MRSDVELAVSNALAQDLKVTRGLFSVHVPLLQNACLGRITFELSATPEGGEAGSEASGVGSNESFSDAEGGTLNGSPLPKIPAKHLRIVPLVPKRTRRVRMNTCGVMRARCVRFAS